MSAQATKIMVVKIGSSTLVGPDGALDEAYLASLAKQVAELKRAGWQPIIVSSAAIACGLVALGITQRPSDMPSLQAAASVGQGVLIAAYARAFSRVGITTSLVLLTRHDTASRHAYLHARDTLERLLELGVVPIVNENDTVSVEEIRFGDNDTLAAVVACLVKADLCVLESDIDGLYDANPNMPNAQKIDVVEKIDKRILGLAGSAGSLVGTGGMATKVKAARVLMVAGIPMVVCHGKEENALVRLAAGEQIGTLFKASQAAHEITNRKLWIALGDASHGQIVVDDGARDALIRQGSSLLCVGVVSAKGPFDAGDVVDIVDLSGHLFARGLVSASSDEVGLARGYTQKQMAENRLLAPMATQPIIHRDELVVFE